MGRGRGGVEMGRGWGSGNGGREEGREIFFPQRVSFHLLI